MNEGCATVNLGLTKMVLKCEARRADEQVE